ncbi:MAG: polyphosphate kinase 2 family protein [Acidimicrobiia bacterium]|nr:polyphosphate kinase 2 family protein [Acidimicrobiia bacterium]
MSSIRDDLRSPVDATALNMAAFPTDSHPGVDSEDDARDEMEGMREQLFDLHEMMFAGEEQRVLLVLQGLDASGKNGTIKHVVGLLNPAGVSVASFTEPTGEEKQQHFLERVSSRVPDPGSLGVFDRSHYEDLLVPLATGSETHDVLDRRFQEVIDFERDLIDGGTVVVKCVLHISYDEQRRRFLRRLRRDDKRWKFAESDLDTRKLWDEYQAAYGEVVARTSRPGAPWYIVPSDHKWYRNWAIARILLETFRDMDLAYPQPALDVEALILRLQPPA